MPAKTDIPRMRTSACRLFIASVLLVLTPAAWSQVSVPYTEDFEGNLPGNNAWADTRFTTLNALTRFLGNRSGGERTELRITTVRNTEYVVVFDLYIFDDWRGTRPGNSSDLFRVMRDGSAIFSESFSNDNRPMSYPKPPAQTGQFGFGNEQDAVFRDITVPFTAQNNETRISWQGQNIRSRNQQSWGIDNVRILTAAAYAAQNQPEEMDNEQEPALTPAQGLTAEWYFPITFRNRLSGVNWDTPVFSSSIQQINWPNTNAPFHPEVPANRFAVRVRGSLTVPQAGQWQFRLGSDDGSDLWINGSRVINNDGNHGFRWIVGTAELTAGSHDLEARMFEWFGAQGFIVQWRAPGQSTWETIPTDAFTPPQAIFADITSSTGLGVTTTTRSATLATILAADLNQDGLIDLVLTGDAQPSVLYNSASGKFESQYLGIRQSQGPAGLLDINHDGFADLIITGVDNSNHGLIFTNNQGSLESSPSAKLYIPSQIRAMVIGDLNANGWADAVFFTPKGNLLSLHTRDPEQGIEPDPFIDPADGLNTPGDVGEGGPTASAALSNTRRPDMFYPLSGGRFFVANPDGSFTTEHLGIKIATNSNQIAGAEFADFDNDGLLDLFIADPRPNQPSTLWRNTANGFVDVTTAAGLDQPGAHKSATWGDINHNGLLDLYIVTADTTPNRLYLNNGDGTFSLAPGEPQLLEPGLDAIFADIDNDGALDLVVLNAGSPTRVLRNSTNDGRSLSVRVLGAGNRRTNAAALGVRIDLLDADGKFLARRDLGMSRGLGGQSPLIAHFGGVEPEQSYIVRVHLAKGPVEIPVVPIKIATTFESSNRTVSRLLTVDESAYGSPVRVIRWQEVSAAEGDE